MRYDVSYRDFCCKKSEESLEGNKDFSVSLCCHLTVIWTWQPRSGSLKSDGKSICFPGLLFPVQGHKYNTFISSRSDDLVISWQKTFSPFISTSVNIAEMKIHTVLYYIMGFYYQHKNQITFICYFYNRV